MPSEEALAASDAVARAVLGEDRVRGAPRVGLYAAFDGELPSRAIFEALRAVPAVRLLPRLRAGVLEWARVDDWDDLVPARFGVLEPVSSPTETLTPNDVVLLPGLAFDSHGWRLGRGGGHYDRAFPPGTDAPWLVGVAYAFQWIPDVPHDSGDRRVDAVVTEIGWALRGEVE